MMKVNYNPRLGMYEVYESLAAFKSEGDAIDYANEKNEERPEMKTEDITVTKWNKGRPTAIDWMGERWVFEPIGKKFKGKNQTEKDDKK